MHIFISYARKDRPAAETVRKDLTRPYGSVWIDEELNGGQPWWDTILAKIRTCDVFVFLLSPESLRSKACQSELRYAVQSGRPLLPVMVAPVNVQLAPRAIADAQIVDYTERTADSALALFTAVSSLPAAPPPPEPPPEAPAPPLSYMNPYREQIQAGSLAFPDQAQLVLALRGHLQVDEEHDTARDLLVELRQRPDIVEGVARDIDQLLGVAQAERVASSTGLASGASTSAPDEAKSPPSVPSPASSAGGDTTPRTTSAPGWHRDPTGRFEYRYWDGARWTEHVSRSGARSVDDLERPAVAPPRFTGPVPSPAGGGDGSQMAAFSSGTLAGLIIATLFVGFVGIIAGATNLKHRARRGQAQLLLWLGIGCGVFQFFWFLGVLGALMEGSYYY